MRRDATRHHGSRHPWLCRLVGVIPCHGGTLRPVRGLWEAGCVQLLFRAPPSCPERHCLCRPLPPQIIRSSLSRCCTVAPFWCASGPTRCFLVLMLGIRVEAGAAIQCIHLLCAQMYVFCFYLQERVVESSHDGSTGVTVAACFLLWGFFACVLTNAGSCHSFDTSGTGALGLIRPFRSVYGRILCAAPTSPYFCLFSISPCGLCRSTAQRASLSNLPLCHVLLVDRHSHLHNQRPVPVSSSTPFAIVAPTRRAVPRTLALRLTDAPTSSSRRLSATCRGEWTWTSSLASAWSTWSVSGSSRTIRTSASR